MRWLDEKFCDVPSWAQGGVIIFGFICIGISIPFIYKGVWLLMDFINGTSTWI